MTTHLFYFISGLALGVAIGFCVCAVLNMSRTEKDHSHSWISVDDRLPEDDVPVIACCAGKWHGETMYQDGYGWYDDEHGRINSKDREPTHWMPFPELPVPEVEQCWNSR